jgi:hypothetical protein
MRKKIFLVFIILMTFLKLISLYSPINPVEIELKIKPNKTFYKKGEIIEVNYDIFLNKKKIRVPNVEYLIQPDYSEDCLESIDYYDIKNTLILINENNYKLNGVFRFKTIKWTDKIEIKMTTSLSLGLDSKDKTLKDSLIYYYYSTYKIPYSYSDVKFVTYIQNDGKGKLAIRVKNINKDMLKDIKVKIVELNIEKFTNDKGQLIFIKIPEGRYNIQIEKEGFLKYYLREVYIGNKMTTIYNQYLPIYDSKFDSINFIEYGGSSFQPGSVAKGVDSTGDILIRFDKALSVLYLREPFYLIINELKIGNISFKKHTKRISNLTCGTYTLTVMSENFGEKTFENIEIKDGKTTKLNLDVNNENDLGINEQLAKFLDVPNKYNTKGNKEGEWVFYLDKFFKPTENLDDIRYYRKAVYKDGKSLGFVRDYDFYGNILFEGKLLSEFPSVYQDTVRFYDYKGNLKDIRVYDKGERIDTNN